MRHLPPHRRRARAFVTFALLVLAAWLALTAATTPVKGTTVPRGLHHATPAATSARGFAGHWEGALVVFGNPITFVVDAEGPPDSLRATISIPNQGAEQMALQNVRARDDSVTFTLRVPGSELEFAGTQRGDSVTGVFHQAGITAPFHLERGSAIVHAPEPPVPYERQDVTYASGEVTLAGTLTRPRGAGRFPAVLLISGSGPQNRDEELFGFKPFAVIADHLTRHGIAVLRVDDRGVGRSTGVFREASSLDFAQDARAGMRFLRRHPNVDARRIGLIGHSEGGLIGPMVAAGNDSVAFLVLLAPPGLRGDSLLRLQGARITTTMGFDDTLRAMNALSQGLLIQAAETGQGLDEARQATRAVLRRAYARAGIAIDDSMLTEAVEAQVTMMTGAWMKYFLTAEPTDALSKVHCPVLVLYGAQDLQVPPDANVPPIERALATAGNRKLTVRVLPSANHLFQQTESGNPALYPTLKKEFVPGLLDTMTTWITAHTRAAR